MLIGWKSMAPFRSERPSPRGRIGHLGDLARVLLLPEHCSECQEIGNSAPPCQFAYLFPSREARDGSSSLGLDEQSLAAPPARPRAKPTPDGNASLRLSRLACRKRYDRLRASGSGAGR